MKKAGLYVRVSTESQAEEGYSIEAQKKLLEAWCISKEISEYKFYVDAGFSGSSLERPEIQALMEDVKKGEISILAVYKLDRLSRSQKDTLYIIEDVLNKHGVDFVSLSENMDTSTPIGRAMLGILSAFAQLERETIKIRTRMGMRERVKNGLWMGGGKTPFGYDYDESKGILVPNADADTVREIYRLFLEGFSPNSIARILGLKYEKLVVQILKRRTNTGVIIYKGEEFNGGHEAIIDDATFNAAQEMFKRRQRGVSDHSPHLLSGLIFCGHCMARMRYQKWGKNGYKLVCYSKQRSKPYLVHNPDCISIGTWAEDVEAEVIDDIFSLSLEKTKKESPQKNYVGEIKKLERKLKRLYELWADGNDTLLDVIKDNEKALETIKEKSILQAKEYENEKKHKKILEEIHGIKDIWNTLQQKEKRLIIRSVVEKIVVFNDKINIYYRF